MRFAAYAVISAAALLAACNPSTPGGDQAAPAASVFPNLFAASYRAEATISGPDGQTMPVVMIRDGAKMRMEMNAAQGQTTMITNADTGESFMITSAAGQTVAMRLTSDQASDPSRDWSGDMSAGATAGGACSAAGETGTEWIRSDNGVEHAACVTSDGIILRSREGERVVWETTSVQRGPQNADLFTVPPGVQVMDLGNMGAAMDDALARAKAAAGQ